MIDLKPRVVGILMLTLALVAAIASAGAQENPFASYSAEELWHMARKLAPYPSNRMGGAYKGTEPDILPIPSGMAYLQQTRYSVRTSIPKPAISIDEDAELKIRILKEIVAKDAEHHWIKLAEQELGLTYFVLRQFEEAIYYLEAARGWYNLVVGRDLGDLVSAYEYLGAVGTAEDVLRWGLEQGEDPVLRFRLGMLLEKQNRLQEALEQYRKVLEDEAIYPYTRSLINQRIDRVLRLQQSGKSLGRITGTVTLNGEGVVGAQVFITMDSNVVSSVPYVVETTFARANGEFELSGVPEGRYRIGIFVPYHLAEGSSVQFVPSLITLGAGEQARADVRLERRSVIGQSTP